MTSTALIVFAGRDWFWPAALACGAVAAALAWGVYRSPGERRVRLGCAALKMTGIVALAFCFLEPLSVRQRARPGANVFAIVADNSQSLQITDAGRSESRGRILRRRLTSAGKDWQASLADNFQVRRYTFDSRAQSVRDFGELDFSGRASALGHTLRTLAERWQGQPIAGVLLFTDGNATDAMGEPASLKGCPPIFPVVLGEEDGLADLALGRIAVSQTAFEDAPVTVQAEVSEQGFGAASVTARLTEIARGSLGSSTNDPAAGRLQVSGLSNLVATARQRAPENGSPLNFRFQLQPEKGGLHFYQMDIAAEGGVGASGEATLVNNRGWLAVDRGQEPFRVLYVGGRPNWEYKFLNRALQDDPQVRMVSLIRVARREPKFDFKGRPGESSNPLFRGFDLNDEEAARYDQPVVVRLNTRDEFELRGGFPKTAQELFQYQAVVLGDVEAQFFTHDQMALLERFVSERGGGFLMLGGAESFREGGYGGTAVASLLPVYLDRPADVTLPGQWTLALTREGWLEPWTRLRATEAEERSRLAAMPAFEVFNPVTEIKPGASVLETVSDTAGHTYPALAIQRFGLGRVAALTIGDMWRWGLRSESSQKDLAKSWRQLVRWLVSDVPPRVSLTVDPSSTGTPGEVRFSVKARDEEFKPLENAAVRLTVQPVYLTAPAEAGSTGFSSDTNVLQLAAEPLGEQPGVYAATYLAREAGVYSVEAAVTQADGKPAGHAAAGWTSDPAAEEFRSLKPNVALLDDLARRTGGQRVPLADLEAFVRGLPDRHAPISEVWNDPLWHKPAVLAFVMGCFVLEWGIRRWKGMP